jgi:hypothetical protein
VRTYVYTSVTRSARQETCKHTARTFRDQDENMGGCDIVISGIFLPRTLFPHAISAGYRRGDGGGKRSDGLNNFRKILDSILMWDY